jgi:hypothetical protein
MRSSLNGEHVEVDQRLVSEDVPLAKAGERIGGVEGDGGGAVEVVHGGVTIAERWPGRHDAGMATRIGAGGALAWFRGVASA